MRGTRSLSGLAAASMVWLAAAAAAQEPPPAPVVAAALALGVAPFETHAPPGTPVPDVASLLAARLAASGASRVVGPAQLGAAAQAETAPHSVQQWAAQAEVDAVVLGRTTRVGDALSLDVRLRRGDTGEVARTFVQRVSRPEDLDGAVAALADEVVAGALALGPQDPAQAAAAAEPAANPAPQPTAQTAAPPAATPASQAAANPASQPAAESPVAAESPAAADPPAAVGARGDTPFGFRVWDSKAPLSILSDELDARQTEGRRTLVFQRGVRVTQGDLTLSCDRLEAVYPAEGNQPDRLTAVGAVHVAQGRQQAWCDQAVYDRARQRLTCEGNARFRDGDDQLSGRRIDIDLAKETINVTGGAEIVIQPETVEKGRPRSQP